MLTEAQVQQYRRDGFLLVPNVYAQASMDAALAEADRLTYGRPFAEVLEALDAGSPPITADRPGVDYGNPFPTGERVLDGLLDCEFFLTAQEQLMGGPVSYNFGHLFVRSGPTDRRHQGEAAFGYHTDQDYLSFLPPSANALDDGCLNSVIYLHDVEADMAPMQILPGTHLTLASSIPKWLAKDSWRLPGILKDARTVPELPPAYSAVGARGSVLFWNSCTLHGAIPFENRRTQRSFWGFSVSRRDRHGFNKVKNIWHEMKSARVRAFFEQTNPQVRGIFGWPDPGHPYYAPETLALLRLWYPNMDLSPYEAGLTS